MRLQARIAGVLLCLCLATAARATDEQPIETFTQGGAVISRWAGARCWNEHSGGFRSLHCVSPGDATPSFFANAKPYVTPFDLTGRFLKVWIKVREIERLTGLELRISSDHFASNYFAFPIPLFQDPAFNVLQPDEWTELTLSFSATRVQGTPDRARIDGMGWYLTDRGTGPVDVEWGAVSSLRPPRKGVLSFTFDDGLKEHVEIAAPLLARFGYRGTAYVIPDQVGSPTSMTLEQLRDLKQRFGWEIAGHHGLDLTQLHADDVEAALLGVQLYLRQHGFGDGAAHFAFPMGKVNAHPVLSTGRKHFATARLAGAGPETLPPADPFKLRVFNVMNTTTPEQIGAAAAAAQRNGDWLILMFHRFVPEPTLAVDYAPAQLELALQQIRASGIQVQNIGEVWAELAKQR